MTDLHLLIHRMADRLDNYQQLLTDDNTELDPLATEARASLATEPPSLKQQALATLQKLSASGYPCNLQQDESWDTIRRALEQSH